MAKFDKALFERIKSEAPRDEIEVYGDLIECHAPDGALLRWEHVPQEIRDEIEANGPFRCEGSGLMGNYCYWCRFAEIHDSAENSMFFV